MHFINTILFFLLITCFSGNLIKAQILSDTIKLNDVWIFDRKGFKPAGVKSIRIDSVTLSENASRPLSEMLLSNGNVFIKTQGPGSLATSSFRGAGSYHTQVVWNGMELNSPMLGQSDFSQLPAAFFDQIIISQNSAEDRNLSGSAGGYIRLDNNPDWNRKLDITVLMHAASYKTWQNFVSLKTGNLSFQSVTRLFHLSSENNFVYLSPHENNQSQRKNASFNQSGLMQDWYVKAGRHGTFSVRIWGQTNFTNIPSTGIFNSDQETNFIRSQTEYKYSTSLVQIISTAGFINDHIKFHGQQIQNHNAQTFHQQSDVKKQFNEGLILSLGYSYNHYIIQSDNYPAAMHRNELISHEGLTLSKVNRFKTVMMLKQDFTDKKFTSFIPSINIDFILLQQPSGIFKFGLSRIYRHPTFNDLYWQADIYSQGNPHLKDENGFHSESGLEFLGGTDRYQWDIEFTAFYSNIKNWIQWKPMAPSGKWQPVNLDVKRQGLEFTQLLSSKSGNFRIHESGSVSFTRSINQKAFMVNDQSVGKQLIFVPFFLFNQNIRLGYQNYQLLLNFSGNSRIYTLADHSEWSPGRIITSLNLQYNLKIRSSSILFSAGSTNIFNVQYEIINGYPLPGRIFEISLQYQFLKKPGK